MPILPEKEGQTPSSSKLHSRIYDCEVMHHRLSPKKHRFAHHFFVFCLDLDEIDRIVAENPLIRRNRFGLYSFYDRDHLPLKGSGDARSNLRDFLSTRGIELPGDARVELVTSMRMLGYVFNPVSFFFCHRADGTPICAVAEVSNTFREMKAFVIPPADASSDAGGLFRLNTVKEFYVSPFFDVEDEFDFRLAAPGDRLDLRVNTLAGGRTAIVATLRGNPLPLTVRNLTKFTLKIPLVTLKVILLIHLHAVLLILKGLPINWKHIKRDRQLDLFNPHRTLRSKT